MAHLTESAIESAAFSWLAEGTQHLYGGAI